MSDLAPPDGPLREVRTKQQVSLRSEPDVASSREAYLEPDVIGWAVKREGDWVECWFHGYVHGNFVTWLDAE